MFNRQYGYLFLINDNIEDTLMFMHYINEGSYVAERKPLDLDPYRDANGVLHRNVVDNVPINVSFNTRGRLSDTEMERLWGAIVRNSYIVQKERKLHATFWVPEINDYVTQDLYVPDPKFTVHQVRKNKNGEYEVVYEPMTFEFIGY